MTAEEFDNQYPEHAKLSGVKEQSQILGEFLDWAVNGAGFCFAEFDDNNDLHPTRKDINTLLSLFYKVDLMKLEEEKVKMLDEIRKNNK